MSIQPTSKRSTAPNGAPRRSRTDYNVRIKYYPQPDGSLRPYQIIVASKAIFDGFRKTLPVGTPAPVLELIETMYGDNMGIHLEDVKDESSSDVDEAINAMIRNYKTAHRRLYDKIQCNRQLNLFVTLTLNEQEISRTNYDEIIKKLSVWLDNRVRRDHLAYILVPEYHNINKARERYQGDDFRIQGNVGIHFHGVMNENGLNLVNSGHKRNGKTVYNINDFPYGFTTAIRITNPKGGDAGDAISKYVHKYMTKALKEVGHDLEKARALKIGGRYYLSGGALTQAQFKYAHFDFLAVDEIEGFRIEEAGLTLKIVTADDSTFSSLLKRLEPEEPITTTW